MARKTKDNIDIDAIFFEAFESSPVIEPLENTENNILGQETEFESVSETLEEPTENSINADSISTADVLADSLSDITTDNIDVPSEPVDTSGEESDVSVSSPDAIENVEAESFSEQDIEAISPQDISADDIEYSTDVDSQENGTAIGNDTVSFTDGSMEAATEPIQPEMTEADIVDNNGSEGIETIAQPTGTDDNADGIDTYPLNDVENDYANDNVEAEPIYTVYPEDEPFTIDNFYDYVAEELGLDAIEDNVDTGVDVQEPSDLSTEDNINDIEDGNMGVEANSDLTEPQQDDRVEYEDRYNDIGD